MNVSATTLPRSAASVTSAPSWEIRAKSGAAPIVGNRSSCCSCLASCATASAGHPSSPSTRTNTPRIAHAFSSGLSRRADAVHPAALVTRCARLRLQFALEFVEEPQLGAVCDHLIGIGLQLAELAKLLGVKAQRVLGIDLAPSVVTQVSDQVERVIVFPDE